MHYCPVAGGCQDGLCRRHCAATTVPPPLRCCRVLLLVDTCNPLSRVVSSPACRRIRADVAWWRCVGPPAAGPWSWAQQTAPSACWTCVGECSTKCSQQLFFVAKVHARCIGEGSPSSSGNCLPPLAARLCHVRPVPHTAFVHLCPPVFSRSGYKAETSLQAHPGGFAALDARGELVASCGYVSRMGRLSLDTYAKVRVPNTHCTKKPPLHDFACPGVVASWFVSVGTPASRS